MKRIDGLYEQIYNIYNLELADEKAKKGKTAQYGVMINEPNRDVNLWELQKMLMDKTYKTSEYTTFYVYEPKKREVFRLPYFPDRILHHAVMNILEPIWMSTFTADTYACLKGRGIHGAARAVKTALKDQKGTQYCLKLDVKKFYPSVDHDILKAIIRKKIKDKDLLWLLDEIIDSAPGLPIGNYLSQFMANLYLSYFDHYLKETKRVKYYFRYCDDLVVLSGSKLELHQLLSDIRRYFSENLNLIIKSNYQIFPVATRGIDFTGYVFFHTHIRLRKGIKKRFAKMMLKRPNLKSIASYYGWLKHCNGRHLLKKLINEKVSRLGDQTYLKEFYRKKHING